MTSQDNERYVTVEMFNKGIAELKAEIRRNTDEIRAEIRVLEREVAVNSAKIDMLQHTFYWGLGIIAIAAVLAPLFRRDKTEQPKPEITRSDVQSMIDAAISKALGVKNQ